MDQGIRIRRAGQEDSAILAEIVRQSFQDVAARFGLTRLNCPRHPSNCDVSWVAADMRRGVSYALLDCAALPVGCVALERSTADLCFLERLSVLPLWRGKGYGGTLVRHALEQARMQGCRTVSIGIIAAQQELAQWYRRLGFVPQETRIFPHLPFEVLFLTRDVTAASVFPLGPRRSPAPERRGEATENPSQGS